MTVTKRDIRSLTHIELVDTVARFSQPSFRVSQLEDWIWNKSATSFEQMSNIPKSLRSKLMEEFVIGGSKEVCKQISLDGSRKYLLEFSDGVCAECVGMPTGSRLSVCVSSQSGCAMGCAFCATGMLGLDRSLTAEEIYEQVIHVATDFGMRVSGVVLMGQGEPFANYNEVLRAMRMMNAPEALAIGARHITVSTCGIVPMIAKFSHEPEQFTLAVSLHSALQETRNMLMPGVRRYSLVHLRNVMITYAESTGRRPSYEYALISGINDTESELQALVNFCSGTLCHVNLIQLNDVIGSPFSPSRDVRVQDFVRTLGRAGVETTVRLSRGTDIDAACGQLNSKSRRQIS